MNQVVLIGKLDSIIENILYLDVQDVNKLVEVIIQKDMLAQQQIKIGSIIGIKGKIANDMGQIVIKAQKITYLQ